MDDLDLQFSIGVILAMVILILSMIFIPACQPLYINGAW